MIKEVKKCRICGNDDLVPVIDLGKQALTGIFPREKNQSLTTGPLELVKCQEGNDKSCGLLQLRHSYEANELYGDHYGYRSSLNRSMVKHLEGIATKIVERTLIAPNDIILDIGSNDSTLLQSYPRGMGKPVGMDPAGSKFKKYYPAHVGLISDFFSAKSFRQHFGTKKAKVVTSVAMFYDLEAPMDFMAQVYDILSDDGLWVFEQSYMPTMLKMTAYDTICHEHFEYYALKQLKWMAERVGFKIVDIEFNATNGGSFQVTVAKKANAQFSEHKELVARILKEEKDAGLYELKPYKTFAEKVKTRRDELIYFVRQAKSQSKKIFGYGASTKGNVILQYCGFSGNDILCIGEVNEDKFGCFTPGTNIPIIPEAEAKKMAPDYFLVLPWHFKDNILSREKFYLESGGALVFPLPAIEICSSAPQPKKQSV